MLARIRAQANQLTEKGRLAMERGDRETFDRCFRAWKGLMRWALSLPVTTPSYDPAAN